MTFPTRSSAGLLAVAALALSGCTTIDSRSEQPLADQRNLIPEVRVDQDAINANEVPFNELYYAGKHIFSNRFTSEDHYGEGPDGPRLSQQAIKDRSGYPFLRFNGLDSQSCLECHLAIGFAPQKNYSSGLPVVRFSKQPGSTGGAAGFASNVFAMENFGRKDGDTTCADGSGEDCSTRGVIRNPPHAFGSGYVQTLAEEMSHELLDQLAEARSRPGVPQNLMSKGISFGSVVVDSNGQVDMSNLQGLSDDLVVRPFQWRGIASNLRNFIRDAMNFHFSVQPRELLREHPGLNDMDGDSAEATNEILEGEISAVATFLAFLRPPVQDARGLDKAMVNQGRRVFDEAECSSCHVPTLTLENPIATIRDPRMDEGMASRVMSDMQGLSLDNSKSVGKNLLAQGYFITTPTRVSPTLQKYSIRKQTRAQNNEATPALFAARLQDELKGYSRNLNRADGPIETLPRLPHRGDAIEIPLFSDLKRHVMGENLVEPVVQRTDGGHEIPVNEFLTRPLWGVADTGPWMHDGRALTLVDAILMHEGTGSEANGSIQKYRNLSEGDKSALRAFLSSLRLPIAR